MVTSFYQKRASWVTFYCSTSFYNLPKNIYLNIAAFADLVIGYALAIFMTDVAISPLYILLFVALAVVVILCTEYFYILKKAKEKYPSAQKVYDSDVKLKTGTIKIFPAETEKENN